MTLFSGIYPPIITNFNDDGSVAYQPLAANLRRWVAQPLDGIVMPGLTAKPPTSARRNATTSGGCVRSACGASASD